MLKRVLLGLLVLSFVLFGAGVALAKVDTDGVKSDVKDPNPIAYENALTGGEIIGVTSLADLMDDPTVPQEVKDAIAEVIDKLDALQADGKTVSFAYVTFTCEDLSELDYNWGDKEWLYNFVKEKFDSKPKEAAAGSLSVKGIVDGIPYLVELDDVYEYGILSIKETGGGSGGCAVFPAGAFILFMLPALALVKRGKK